MLDEAPQCARPLATVLPLPPGSWCTTMPSGGRLRPLKLLFENGPCLTSF